MNEGRVANKSSGKGSKNILKSKPLPARSEASGSLQQELQEGNKQMCTGATSEAGEARKRVSFPLPDLEVTSGCAEATSGSERATSGSAEATSGSAETTSGKPRRATKLPERYGEYRCHNTRLSADYTPDNVRMGELGLRLPNLH